jgi:LytR cell envelope-related transcriptional attenuator
MSNEQPSRPRRSGSGASPMGSTLAIVIAIAAVVVGFLILKNIRSDNGDATVATTLPTPSTQDPATASSLAPLVTEPPVTSFTATTAGAKVLVANSSHANGVAKVLSTALAGKQFTMGTPTNGGTKEAVTKIEYKDGDPAAQAVALSVAQLMGVASVEIIPTPVLLGDPTLLADNTVVVLLGDDKASKTLAQMTAASTDTTPSSVAGGATATTAAP